MNGVIREAIYPSFMFLDIFTQLAISKLRFVLEFVCSQFRRIFESAFLTHDSRLIFYFLGDNF